MLFSEEDAPLLKAWIVKRIEDTSDADADVLAEYVIALLKHDGDADAVRKLCEQEIPDFLSEDPKAFLDDVFQAIAYRSYLPGAPPAPKIGVEPVQQPLADSTTPNSSRKRGFYDREEYDPQDGYESFNRDGRVQKQPRRGGRGGRGDDMRGGRPGAPTHNLPPRPDMPFDPKVMEAFLQMGSMGMPYPGMPNFPQQGFGGGRGQPRRRGRCRDFDTKGFCSRGSTCPYDHGNESIFVPPGTDAEYDPSDPFAMLANAPNSMNPWTFPPDGGRGGRGGRRNRGAKKGGSRAPFSAEGPNYDRTKSTIVVENIPEESFSEEQVREFFSQFGNIQEVSMQPYKHLAIVKYDKWGSANAAYQSPKVIFDNRFVKVFWYKDKIDTLPASAPLQGGNWSGDPMAAEDDEVLPEIDMEEFQRKQEEEQKKHQEREAQRAKIEQERQEVVKKHQELLARHREENEKLQAKLASQRGEDGDANSGRGGGNMHAAYAQYSIDNRPKKLAITGVDFTAPDKDEMLRHFLLNLGEFESVDTAPETTHVSFQDRKTAEKFYYSLNGKELPGIEGRLELAWVNTPLPPVKTLGNDDAPRHGVEDDAMADFDDQPRREKSAEPQREERAVNMDYEVAEEDAW
ncbi:hypothetical protein AU210_002776 [Fusarium oxysporum f. sp. radicis-cucumerinum]|uniref:RNA-binding protein n=1 Tax=Fusarium oxysporum f. sp. radicis-cucumerinum TaxID=327505 RepID=A0A2H3HNN9_FUSOX|nr:hypothetical protein AU210_002776 [Fusarium oxysporum f. sp. radicis-cucumerinum]